MMIGSPIGLLSSAVLLALTFADCLLPVALDLEVRRINDDDRIAHFFLLFNLLFLFGLFRLNLYGFQEGCIPVRAGPADSRASSAA